MSRSNPTERTDPNPCARWFEWSGSEGVVRYYDRDKKENVVIGNDFGFILLDQLGGVTGWSDKHDSGIFSNEVKDTLQDVLLVKTFAGHMLAEGVYKAIKDKVNAQGGNFTANLYIAFKGDGSDLVIGSLRLKGAALMAWSDFEKKHRADLYKKAIRIKGFDEGKKGKVVFRTPKFSVVELTEESNQQAVQLDAKLQEYFGTYLKQRKVEQAAQHKHIPPSKPAEADEMTEDDIPF